MNGQPFTPDERAAVQREAAALYRQGHTIRCVSGVIGRLDAVLADFQRYELPVWTTVLHRMAVRLGRELHPEPAWLILHDRS